VLEPNAPPRGVDSGSEGIESYDGWGAIGPETCPKTEALHISGICSCCETSVNASRALEKQQRSERRS